MKKYCRHGHELTEENTTKNGRCKICQKEANHKYYLANPERTKEIVNRWRTENPEKVKESSRKYYAENSEKKKEAVRNYYAANPEKVKEASRKKRAVNSKKIKNNISAITEITSDYDGHSDLVKTVQGLFIGS